MADQQQVKLHGGPLHGAVLEVPADLVDRLNPGHLTITSGGTVFDRKRGQAVRGAKVLKAPVPRQPTP